MFGEHTHVVLLAGGEGTRFAPLSTPERPKQFLTLFGERSMIQETAARFDGLVAPERMWASTNTRYVPLVREHLPALPESNIFPERMKKNTAPAIAITAHELYQRDPEAMMIVLPSDHTIFDRRAFLSAMRYAETIALQHDTLVTLGIRPDRPATEYGYIEQGDPLCTRAFTVKRFVEKPDVERATAYLASCRYFWNSGMFIWTAARLLHEIQTHLPELHAAITDNTTMESRFEQAPTISIDYGLMERSNRVATIPVECGWNDIGSWKGLRDLAEQRGIQLHADVLPYLEQYS